MSSLDIVIVLVVIFAVYNLFNIRKDYREYKKSKHYLEYNIFIRNLGVIIGGIILIIYKILSSS